MRKGLAAVVIAVIGAVGLAKDISNYLTDPELTPIGFLVTTGVPMFINLALIGTALWLWYDDTIPPLRTVLPWVFGIGIVFLSLEWVTITHQDVRGVDVANPTQTLVNGFIRGAFVGTLFALYADRRRVAERQRRKLSAQNDRLERFAGIVSHDLRNPLSVARGRMELLAERVDSEHVPPIERAHDRMATLIDELLSLATGGERDRSPERVDLGEVVDACWLTVDSGEAALENDLEGTTVRADRSRCKQLLENLLRNAVEHGSTSPRSSSTREDVTVTVGSLADGFYVADDGPGIPPTERDGIFEAGYSPNGGTGIGLAIVAEVASEHGWDVSATESERGGARFEMTGVEGA